MNKSKYIGNKEFYKMVLVLLLPMVIQQGITNFVSLVDNIMVGRLGTEPMSGVAIVNQLVFVFNITIFGCLSGAGIYGAQFFGNKDTDGVRYTFRFKIIIGTIISTIVIIVFSVFGENLIKLYLNEGSSNIGDLKATLKYAQDYLKILLLGLIPFMVTQCYSTTLRETGETMLPMIGSGIAIVVNLSLNAILIFGFLGFPKLGVRGAAIATVISRYVEIIYIIIRTHKNSDKFIFIRKAFRTLYIPSDIVKKIIITGTPLLLNEFMWSMGMTIITQCYAYRGLEVIAAYNISSTVSNLFMIVLFAMGNAISILVGQQLGAGNIEKAKDIDRKLVFFNVSMYVVIGVILFILSPIIPHIYKTEEIVRTLSTDFLKIYSIVLPIFAFNHSAYFTMRSGGKTVLTFLFDSVFVWVVSLPIAYVLSRFTGMSIVLLYFVVNFSEIIKSIIGAILLKKGIWAHNIIK